jgi:hypothetical protein
MTKDEVILQKNRLIAASQSLANTARYFSHKSRKCAIVTPMHSAHCCALAAENALLSANLTFLAKPNLREISE